MYWFIFDIHSHCHLPARICHLDHIPRIRPSQAGRIRQPGSLFSQISHKDCHPLPLPQIDHVVWVVKKRGFMLYLSIFPSTVRILQIRLFLFIVVFLNRNTFYFLYFIIYPNSLDKTFCQFIIRYTTSRIKLIFFIN